MKTITVAGHKGGLGKTTLRVLLAHAWQRQGRAVSMIDLDPQKSLTEWWSERGEDDPLNLVEIDHSDLAKAKDALEDQTDYLIIDTPPAHQSVIVSAIKASDLTIVPCSPSSMDFRGIGETISVLEQEQKPFFTVVNRAISRSRLRQEAVPYLAQFGKVAPEPLILRMDYAQAFMGGASPLDMNNPAIEEEVKALLEYTEKQLEKIK